SIFILGDFNRLTIYFRAAGKENPAYPGVFAQIENVSDSINVIQHFYGIIERALHSYRSSIVKNKIKFIGKEDCRNILKPVYITFDKLYVLVAASRNF